MGLPLHARVGFRVRSLETEIRRFSYTRMFVGAAVRSAVVSRRLRSFAAQREAWTAIAAVPTFHCGNEPRSLGYQARFFFPAVSPEFLGAPSKRRARTRGRHLQYTPEC